MTASKKSSDQISEQIDIEDGAETHERWMVEALLQADKAEALGEVPVGAVLVAEGVIIGAGFNQPIASHDPTAHAEIMAIRAASQARQNYRLPGTTLYVTIEPCTMCLGALIHARVEHVVFGAREPRAGALISQQSLPDDSHFNHQLSWTEGVLAQRCAARVQDFFRAKRKSS